MTGKRISASIISRLIAFSLPLILAGYWPFVAVGQSTHAGAIVIRVAVLGAVAILALLWTGQRTTSVELQWAAILACYLGSLLMESLLSGHFTHGARNWLRIAVMYCIGVGLARPLRHKPTAQAFGAAMGIAGLGSLLFILVIYLRYNGLSLLDYKQIREFKSQVQHAAGVALNPLGSATLLFCALHLCLSKSGWKQRALTLLTALSASVFTGSRAPFAMAFAGVAALYLSNWLSSRDLSTRTIAAATAFFSVTLLVLALTLMNPVRLSAATEGRYDLWTVGMAKFFERPLTGYGAESWSDDLVGRLPGYYPGPIQAVEVRAGGYHSEFVTLLAEGGLLCFLPAMFIFWKLFQNCWRIAYHPSMPRFQGQAILFTFYLIFLRACIEIPGLFGYGEDVTDYLAAMFVAIVMSQASLLGRCIALPVSPGAVETQYN